MVSDPYSVLGIGRDADKDEIKRAYRKKAKEYHPDLHPNDPKAAEKMNEINEAYDMLSNPEKYQKREQSNTGYQSYYGRSTYNQNTYSDSNSNQGYGNYWGFDFEDLFGFGQRHQEIQKPSRDMNDTEDIKEAVDFICMGNYEYANRILNQVVSARRDARWHYLSALANYGLGNSIRALEEIQRAMQMEPENQTYSQIYNSMRQSGNAYHTSSQNYQQYADGMQQYCRSFLMLQCFCMFCRCC